MGITLGRLPPFWPSRQRGSRYLRGHVQPAAAQLGGLFNPFGRPALHAPALQPRLLRVDARIAHAAALAPRAGDLAGFAAEVRDHLAGAPAGHALWLAFDHRTARIALRR